MLVPLDVLVVDDDECTCELMAYAVRSFGHRCRTASNGDAALEAIAASPPSVILSDLEMPGIDGTELCRLARRAEDAALRSHFIILSGSEEDERRRAAVSAGADEYWRKPVDLDDLEARLNILAQTVRVSAVREPTG